MTDWTRETLLGCIKEIHIPKHHHLLYIFQDGHTEEVYWEHHSRKESWTKEMREKAREEQIARIERKKSKWRL